VRNAYDNIDFTVTRSTYNLLQQYIKFTFVRSEFVWAQNCMSVTEVCIVVFRPLVLQYKKKCEL
jgi:hypothetical protein